MQWLHTGTCSLWPRISGLSYDNRGIEVHCIKKMDQVTKQEYLPYHFLLVGGNERGASPSWMSPWGILSRRYGQGWEVDVMCQNPATAMVGHSKGTVTVWTPSMKVPAANMLVHRQPVRAGRWPWRGAGTAWPPPPRTGPSRSFVTHAVQSEWVSGAQLWQQGGGVPGPHGARPDPPLHEDRDLTAVPPVCAAYTKVCSKIADSPPVRWCRASPAQPTHSCSQSTCL